MVALRLRYRGGGGARLTDVEKGIRGLKGNLGGLGVLKKVWLVHTEMYGDLMSCLTSMSSGPTVMLRQSVTLHVQNFTTA